MYYELRNILQTTKYKIYFVIKIVVTNQYNFMKKKKKCIILNIYQNNY